jgi:ectoine hydroxylase-related dioxygenase (phytanoyl-CoA dioxygenase family)|eukprot:COSAG01_NODE_2475_length_7623_cov_8.394072_3_plen_121_part_00
MMLLPGTHHPYVDRESHQAPSGSIVSREVDVSAELEGTAVTVGVPAGSVSIHDSYLLHGSGYNTSGKRRAAYTIRYLNARLGFCDTEQHPVPAFLVRGDAGSHGDMFHPMNLTMLIKTLD